MICQGLSHIHIPLRENVFDDILSCVNKFDLSNVEDVLAGDQNNEKRRKCKLSWLAYDETVDYNRKLYSILWDIGKYYALQMGVNNWKIEHIESIQYTSYDVGDHYNWHVDVHPHTDFRRKLSGIILLNDDYTGGEIDLETKIPQIDFSNRFTRFSMKKGDLLFFDSTLPHRVRKVTSGNRKSLVFWYNGPLFV